MAKIKQIVSHEILNSKGNPTIETSVYLNEGTVGTASCPIGTSVGSYEAYFLTDKDTRFEGLGVLKAIENISSLIAPHLIGMDAEKQQEIDRIMIDIDGTQNKSRLGANAILSVSMAVAKAAAKASVLPLFLYLREFIKKDANNDSLNNANGLKIPIPLFNLINGGVHAGKTLDFQEFLVIPASSKSYTESLEIGVDIYRSLKKLLNSMDLSILVGDEGGFSPKLKNNQDVFPILTEAIERINARLDLDVFFGLDCAASSFFKDRRYLIKDIPQSLSSMELMSYYETLNKKQHFLYIEDPFAQDDWESFSQLTARMSETTIIAGDNLTATNPYRLSMALNKKAITGIVIKPNQTGTVIEAMAVVEVARQAGLKIVVSSSNGETNDDFIADFSVAVSADYVKFGAPARGERVAKYNRLLQIENQIKAL